MGIAKQLYRAAMAALPARRALSIQHLIKAGGWPNLERPTSFNEKVLHRKIHEDSDIFVLLADKVLVKDVVARAIGDEFVIPTIWSGTSLPEQPGALWPRSLVVKANHASGKNAFVHLDGPYDWEGLKATASRWIAESWYPHLHERWYNRMVRQVLVEPFIGEGGDPPPDHKFFVFDGVVRVIQLDVDRFADHRRSFYSPQWERLHFSLLHPPLDVDPAPPQHLELMIQLASRLGSGLPFVRVDFYDLPSGPKFGEMTFAPGAGVERFSPRSADRMLGEYWTGPTT